MERIAGLFQHAQNPAWWAVAELDYHIPKFGSFSIDLPGYELKGVIGQLTYNKKHPDFPPHAARMITKEIKTEEDEDEFARLIGEWQAWYRGEKKRRRDLWIEEHPELAAQQERARSLPRKRSTEEAFEAWLTQIRSEIAALGPWLPVGVEWYWVAEPVDGWPRDRRRIRVRAHSPSAKPSDPPRSFCGVVLGHRTGEASIYPELEGAFPVCSVCLKAAVKERRRLEGVE